MSLYQLVEYARKIFRGGGKPHGVQPPSIVQSVRKETQAVPDIDTVAAISLVLHLSGKMESEAAFGSDSAAAIAAALYLYGKTESAAVFNSDTAAAIAAALHLYLIGTKAAYESDKINYALSSWSHYGREQIQNKCFKVFNRPVSSEKSILILKR